MIILDRYILKKIINTFLVALIPLLVLLFSNQYFLLAKKSSSMNVHADQLFFLVWIQLPVYISYSVPPSLFLAFCWALSKLYSHNELVVMLASGYSRCRLFLLCGLVALFAFLCLLYATLILIPHVEEKRSAFVLRTNSSLGLDSVEKRKYMPLHDGRVVFSPDAKAGKNVLQPFYMFSHEKKRWVLTRSDAIQEKNEKGIRHFILSGSHTVEVTPGLLDVTEKNTDEENISIVPTQAVVKKSVRSVRYTDTGDLWRLSQTDARSAAELHWRLAIPLSVLVLFLFSFFITQIEPRQSVGWIIFPALLFYTLYMNSFFLMRMYLEKMYLASYWGMWPVHGAALVCVFTVAWKKKVKNSRSRFLL